MTRSITAVWTAAVCAIALAAAQPAASAGEQTATQGKTAAKPSAPPKVGTATKSGTTTASAPVQTTASASMTGCLQEGGGKYILTDVEGKQAPKGHRTWKTGFIVKSGKDVEVVGASGSVRLKEQVGHKVTVMGTRDGDTRFKAQSVKQLSRSCS